MDEQIDEIERRSSGARSISPGVASPTFPALGPSQSRPCGNVGDAFKSGRNVAAWIGLVPAAKWPRWAYQAKAAQASIHEAFALTENRNPEISSLGIPIKHRRIS